MIHALAAGPGFTVPDVTELLTWRTVATLKLGSLTLHITELTLIMFTLTAVLCLVFATGLRKAAVVPHGLQNVLEAAFDGVRENVVLPVLGPHGEVWMPFLSTVFFWVFAMNFLEIVPPISFPITSRMAYPAFLAGLAYVIFNVVGIKTHGLFRYLKINLFPPGVPKPIYIILTPIEFFSTFVFRPVTLAVRLFANMMAGHVMLTIFFLATTYFIYVSNSMFLKVLTPFPFILSIVLVGFEVFIGLIQAFIITILSAVYIAGASESEH